MHTGVAHLRTGDRLDGTLCSLHASHGHMAISQSCQAQETVSLGPWNPGIGQWGVSPGTEFKGRELGEVSQVAAAMSTSASLREDGQECWQPLSLQSWALAPAPA